MKTGTLQRVPCAPYTVAFMEAMRDKGIAYDSRYSEPIDDGRLHRYQVEGDKPDSKNGWYVLHGGRIAAGCFGSWKLGERHNWCSAKQAELTQDQRELIQRHQEQARLSFIEEKLQVHQRTAEVCNQTWNSARGLFPVDHPYLARKKVPPFGIRQLGKALLTPVRTIEGQIASLQYIYPNGKKWFKTGGKTKGCFHRIGRPVDKTIYICEGYATGATIHKLTGHAVAIAFYANNLVTVATLLRDKYPDYRLYIAADNDRFTEGNPGLTQARKAARLADAGLLVPFFEDDEEGSDFNDRALLDGSMEVFCGSK